MTVAIPGVLPGPREYQALFLVAEGLTNPQIARRMSISESTARSYVEKLMIRFEASGTRANLVHQAHRCGALSAEVEAAVRSLLDKSCANRAVTR